MPLTLADLLNEINVDLPTNTSGVVRANVMRQLLSDIVSNPQGGGGGSGGGGAYYVNSNTTAALGATYYCDTSAGSFTLTLPTNPANGSMVGIRDAMGNWSTANLIVAPGSNGIDGVGGSLSCDTSDANFDLVWRGGSIGWGIQYLIAPLIHKPTVIRTGAFSMDGSGAFAPTGQATGSVAAFSMAGSGGFAAASATFALTTWDAANKATHVTLSGGNLTAALGASGVANEGVRGTRPLTGSAVKRYEVTINSLSYAGPGLMAIGIATPGTNVNTRIGSDETTSAAGVTNGFIEGPSNNSGADFFPNVGDVVGVEAWAATGSSNGGMQVYINGTWLGWVQYAPTGGNIYPAISFGTIGDSVTANFGATAFVYPLGSGVLAWNS